MYFGGFGGNRGYRKRATFGTKHYRRRAINLLCRRQRKPFGPGRVQLPMEQRGNNPKHNRLIGRHLYRTYHIRKLYLKCFVRGKRFRNKHPGAACGNSQRPAVLLPRRFGDPYRPRRIQLYMEQRGDNPKRNRRFERKLYLTYL